MLPTPTSKVETPTPKAAWTFEAQTGFFSHDTDPSDWSFRATTRPRLGLLDRTYPTDESCPPESSGRGSHPHQWKKFHDYVTQLNARSPPNTHYKVLYLARHGEGIHNVAERKMGKLAWDSTWSKLDGDASQSIIWRDAELTQKGKQDALRMATFWRESISNDGVVFPQRIYSSPLRRCLMTTELTFRDVCREENRPFHPIIKELLRERLHDQTCNARSSKSWITRNFPDFVLDDEVSEDDELWIADREVETDEEHDRRSRAVLEAVFEETFVKDGKDGRDEFIALEMHALSIRSVMRVVGYREVAVGAGETFPLFVKGVRHC